MATDIERLVVQMDAKITGLQNGVNKAMGITNKMHRDMTRGNKQLATSFRNVASSIAVMHGPLGGIASRFSSTASIFSRTNLAMGAMVIGAGGVTFAFGKMLGIAREAIAEFDKLGKSARTAGISTDLYQSLGFAALEEGVDGLESAIDQFTVRVGALRNGQGELATFLDKTNKSLLEQLQLSTNQEERLRLVADAIRDATTAEEKATIARAAFGRSGVDMVRILKDGADGLDDFTRRARELGIVVDREVIARSEEMNNQLGVAQRIIDIELKRAFVDLAPVVIAAAQAIAAVAAAIGDVADSVKILTGNIGIASSGALQSQLDNLVSEYREYGNLIDEIQASGRDLSTRDIWGNVVETHEAQIEVIREQMQANLNSQAEIMAILLSRKPSAVPDAAPGEIVPVGGGSKSSPFMSAMQSIADRVEMVKAETEAMRSLNPLVNDYGYALEYARAKQQLLNAAKKEGLVVTPELASAIHDMASALAEATVEAAQLTEQQDNLRQSWEEWRDVSKSAMRSFIDDLVEGKTATEALGSALQQLGNHLINLGLNSLFGSGGNDFGLFGRMFGFADGGYTGPGGKHQAAGVVHKGEYVFSKEATQRAGVGNLEAMHRSLKGYASGGLVGGLSLPAMPSAANDNAVSLTYAPQIDARGADMAAVARLEQVMQRDRAEFEGRVQAVVRGRGRKWK